MKQQNVKVHIKMTSQADRKISVAERQCVVCIPFAVKLKCDHSTNTRLQQYDIDARLLRHEELVSFLQSLLQAGVHAADEIIICNTPFTLVFLFSEALAQPESSIILTFQ